MICAGYLGGNFMRYGLMVVGFCGVIGLFFVVVPAEKVGENVFESDKCYRAGEAEPVDCPRGWAAWAADAPSRKVSHKNNGLRMAVEGRPKWLGVAI